MKTIDREAFLPFDSNTQQLLNFQVQSSLCRFELSPSIISSNGNSSSTTRDINQELTTNRTRPPRKTQDRLEVHYHITNNHYHSDQSSKLERHHLKFCKLMNYRTHVGGHPASDQLGLRLGPAGCARAVVGLPIWKYGL